MTKKRKQKAKHGGARKGAGRPRVTIDPADVDRLQELCRNGAPHVEIAAWLRISPRTLESMLRDEKTLYTVTHPETKKIEKLSLSAIMERGYAHMRIGIRRSQIKLLEAGNATMAVWLGKQYLGQTDRMRVEEPPKEPEAEVEIPVTLEELLRRRDRDVVEFEAKGKDKKK